jgi:hypothetical protein
MPLSSNGISPEVIRGIMPPYHLSTDLLGGALRALAAPPADATTAWRHARIARLVQEIGGLMPADAPQARIAAQIVIVREATDDTVAQSHAPGLTVEQICRLRRTAADLTRSAATLERSLGRRQATPAPFFGAVEADAVDIGALDAVWCKGASGTAGAGVVQQAAAPEPAADGPCPTAPVPGVDPGLGPVGPRAGDAEAPDHAAPPVRVAADPPASAPNQPDAAALIADAEASPAVVPLPLAAEPTVRGRRDRSADAAARPGRDTAAPPAWTTTRLDQGPGWTLEVVRPPRDGEAGGGAAPVA